MYQNVNTIKLDNEFTVLYVHGLDGGGHHHLSDFKQVVDNHGKDKYTNAVEWCAGFGVIGFDFLNRDMCEHMSFIDYFEPAIHWINETAKHNKIEGKITTFETGKISTIPETEKWDLVLANPPHCFDEQSRSHIEQNTPDEYFLGVALRLVYDEEFETHKEFFKNIRKNLLPGADLFLSEVSSFEVIEKLANEVGLEVIGRHPAPKLSKDSHTNAVILHFKEPG